MGPASLDPLWPHSHTLLHVLADVSMRIGADVDECVARLGAKIRPAAPDQFERDAAVSIWRWQNPATGGGVATANTRAKLLSAFTLRRGALHIPIVAISGNIMAQKATIHKVELSVSDMDRHYYETHKLTVAKHPSETDERLMVRILAFALNAHDQLEMTKGLSSDDEPDIWQKSLSGELELWVTLGQPSEKIVRQSCGKAKDVIIYCYGRTADVWWDKIKGSTTRFNNLQVIHFTEVETLDLANLASRSMKIQVNIQEGDVMLSVDDNIVYVTPNKWKTTL